MSEKNLPNVFELSTIQEILKLDFLEFEKSIISFIDSRAKNGSNKDVDTYILFLVYQFYKEHKNLVAKDKIYQDNEVVIQISQGGGKFGDIKITMGMLYFYQEFVTNRLFNVKKSTRYELSDLINKKNLSDDEEERKELLLEEVQERVLKAKGLKDILMRSNGSMESFRGILLKSMQQFFLEIPSDNTVLDKEWKKITRLITNKPENASVRKAFEKAYQTEGTMFAREQVGNTKEYIYFAININKNYFSPEIDTNINLYDNIDLVEQRSPEFNFEEGRPNFSTWRPYSYENYIRILKIIYRHYGEQPVSMYELKEIFATIFIDAKKIDYLYKESSYGEFPEAEVIKSKGGLQKKDGSKSVQVYSEDNDSTFSTTRDILVYEELSKLQEIISSFLDTVFEHVDKNIIQQIFNSFEEKIKENYQNQDKVDLFINIKQENQKKELEECLEKLSSVYKYLPKLEELSLTYDELIYLQFKELI